MRHHPSLEISTRTVIGVGRENGGVYWLQQLVPGVCVSAIQISSNSALLWHRRLGHPSSAVLASISQISFDKESLRLIEPCDSCFKATQTRLSFPESSNKASDLFHLVHCDVWGPYSTPNSTGARSFLTIVDDFSRAVFIYFIQAKSDVASHFRSFCAMVQAQFDCIVRRVRTDNGTEFLPLRSYLDEKGIVFETSCVATPQQNGRAERKHRHLLNVAQALRFQACLPIDFWGECVSAAAHLINRTPSPVIGNKSPHEILYKQAPVYNHVRVFGCLCFASQTPRTLDKFAPRGRKCVFLGYPPGKRGWLLYDLEQKSQFVSRDVVFFEEVFPFASSSANPAPAPSLSSLPSPSIFDDDLPAERGSFSTTANSPSEITTVVPTGSVSPLISSDTVASSSDVSLPGQTLIPAPQPVTRTSDRIRQPSTRLRDFVCNTIQSSNPSSPIAHPTSIAPSSGTSYPIENYVNCANFSTSHVQYLAAVTAQVEPTTYKEAALYPCWRLAMGNELDALQRNGTWTLTPLPPSKKPIGCKWVFRIKYHSDGSIECHKARLVVLGNRQIEGVDYGETFAPVAKMTSVRVFLSVAAVRGWELHQMDVHNAFLHGDLDEEVYMAPPPGLSNVPAGHVCRLQKSLYGLKQAPRNWFAKLSLALSQYGFIQSMADYSLFSYTAGVASMHVLVYVDDLIVAGNDSATISVLKNARRELGG